MTFLAVLIMISAFVCPIVIIILSNKIKRLSTRLSFYEKQADYVDFMQGGDE